MNGNIEVDGKKLLELTTGITKPWSIDKVEIDVNGDCHIYVKYNRGEKFPCKICGNISSVHDTKEKVWRHLNLFQYKTFIHCKLPRVKCSEHGVHLIDVPWAYTGSGFTMLFETYVMCLSKEMPIRAVSRLVDEHDTRIWRIVHRYVNKYKDNFDFSNVTKIGLDETSRVGHNYISVFVDLDTSKVLYVCEGKKSKNVKDFREFFEAHKGIPEKVTDFTTDMTMGFKNEIKRQFKNAAITFDKFHVVKVINEAVDKVRKSEQAENEDLKGSRYIWIKNRKNLKTHQQEKLDKMCKQNLKTAKAYRLKIAFQGIYNTKYTKKIAQIEFMEWINWAVRSNLEPFKKAAKTIGMKMECILNYFESNLTNAVLEGVNSLIQSTKSKARGYRRFDNFIAMVYLINSKDAIVG